MSQGRHLNELSSNYTQLWTADRLLAESVDALKACFSSSEAVLGLEIADESERCHHQGAKLSEHIEECEAETSRIALSDGSLLREIGDAKDALSCSVHRSAFLFLSVAPVLLCSHALRSCC